MAVDYDEENKNAHIKSNSIEVPRVAGPTVSWHAGYEVWRWHRLKFLEDVSVEIVTTSRWLPVAMVLLSHLLGFYRPRPSNVSAVRMASAGHVVMSIGAS